ncbi:spore coat protein [Clostridium beijerinckii]|uniref:Spore coat protein n=1 Tax=Clostridium beijerinckii TaxID=1520 RepID=A0A1S8S5X9_CLOBE|nr:spore coat protein [Clostridium beijerinckii]NRY63754.1 hypothetical protein [Clostridium beijerinckii]OOM60715.1 hypothetical protein CLBCK_27920 [Clostridium beijerinckii]
MHNGYLRDDMATPSIVSLVRGDVNGDGTPDNVYLTGIKTSDSPFTQNITLVIQDVKTGRFINIPLIENSGYNPKLSLGKFTDNSIYDIFISINSGGSGGIMYYYIYSFIDNNPQLLFDFNSYNEEYNYSVTYKDNYKVEVVSRQNDKNYIIDISNSRDDEYIHEIYYENGKLKSPISGFVNPLSGLYPVDFDSNNVYELLAYQRIAGRYNADSLGYVLNTLKWKNNMFILDNQYVAIF